MPMSNSNYSLENNNSMEPNISNRTREGFYDQVDSALTSSSSSNSNGERSVGRQAVSGSTQTDDIDSVDSNSRSVFGGRSAGRNGLYSAESSSSCNEEGGMFSNLITRMLPVSRRKNDESQNDCEYFGSGPSTDRRCASTQTEESPISIRAYELCCMIIQELVLETPIPSSARDEVFESLSCCVCEILDKHSMLFNGMVRRFEVTDYRVFTCVANELFEASTDNSGFRITWGRVVSLYAFAVRLAQKYKESQDEDRLDNVVHYLSDYISRHLLDFVENEGGWEGLVKQFPVPDTEDKQIKRAMLWSGLCVGLVATMYVSSFLSK